MHAFCYSANESVSEFLTQLFIWWNCWKRREQINKFLKERERERRNKHDVGQGGRSREADVLWGGHWVGPLFFRDQYWTGPGEFISEMTEGRSRA